MSHFSSRIKAKALDAKLPPVLIVAYGDSVTQGAMELGRLAPQDVYHSRLQRKLEHHYPTTTFSTLNAGVGGSSAPQALERLERDVIRHDPDLVLIAFGLNDSLGGEEKLPAFVAALEQMITEIKASTAAQIMLLTPPHMAGRKDLARIHPQHHGFADTIIAAQTSGTLASYAQAVRAIAAKHAVALADVHTEWTRLKETGTDTDLWLTNGLNHPDARGHELAATLVFHALLQTQP